MVQRKQVLWVSVGSEGRADEGEDMDVLGHVHFMELSIGRLMLSSGWKGVGGSID